MPTLAQSHLVGDASLTRKEATVPPVHAPAPQLPYWLQKSPFSSTPLPPLTVSVDNTRNFYREGLPQFRIIPAQGK
jgi:hypothetical protein